MATLNDSKKIPFVSVIIPVKNEEKNIGRCIEGIRSCNYPEELYEIIVIDNGSTDNTKNIVKEFAGVILLIKEEGTIGALRNFGAMHAKGEIIAFLDGDCIPDRKWLKVGRGHLMMDKDISCIGFTMEKPSSRASWVEKTWYKMNSGSKYKGICTVRWLSSFNLILRKDMFLRIGGFDESIETCEDADLGFRLNKIGKLIFSDEIAIKHLGTVKTIKELFLKELWRGKGNLKSFLQNDDKMKNIASVFIPLIYIALVLLMMVFLLLYIVGIENVTAIYLIGMLIIFLPALLAIIKQKTYQITEILKVAFLYFIYLCARGLAIFKIELRKS